MPGPAEFERVLLGNFHVRDSKYILCKVVEEKRCNVFGLQFPSYLHFKVLELSQNKVKNPHWAQIVLDNTNIK